MAVSEPLHKTGRKEDCRFGGVGTGDGQFLKPSGIAVGDFGLLYVSDVDAHRIQCFSAEGTFIMKWGEYGSGKSQFVHPMGVDVGSCRDTMVTALMDLVEFASLPPGIVPMVISYIGTDRLYVADCYNHRIQKLTDEGVMISEWGRCGHADGDLWYPISCAVDEKYSSLWVADQGNARIQVFDLNGLYARDAGFITPAHCTPVSVRVHNNKIYVLDIHDKGETVQHRIQCFSYHGETLWKWISNVRWIEESIEYCDIMVQDDNSVYIRTSRCLYKIEENHSLQLVYDISTCEHPSNGQMATGNSGNMYLVDTLSCSIVCFFNHYT